MNRIPIVVYDFETSSTDKYTTQPLQLAAIVINPRTLEPYPNAEFNSDIRPSNKELVEAGALKVNGITEERMDKAPELKQVWSNFVQFVQEFNFSKTKSVYDAPISAGKNIDGFDSTIIQRLCKEYGPKDKKGDQALFNRVSIDLEDIIWMWFENSNDLPDKKMDTIRQYFGMPMEGAHDALVDVKHTAALITRFLHFHRSQASRTSFKNSFAGKPI